MFVYFICLITILLSDIRERVGHRVNRHSFEQKVSRKHFLSKQDIRNVKRSVLDRQIKCHENDAMSVAILDYKMSILFYKPQGSESEKKASLRKDFFFLALQTEFQMELYQNFPTKFCVLMP